MELQTSSLTSISNVQGLFLSYSRLAFLESLNWKFVKGVVRVIYQLRMAEITSGNSFEPNNPTEQNLGAFKS